MLFFFSSLFLADADIGNFLSSAEDGKSYNYWQEFINMLITLGVVLALIFVTVWLLKRLMASRSRHLNKGATIQVLERRSLSQKSALYLVRVEQKKIVVSDSPAGISLICECNPEKEVEFIEEEEEPTLAVSAPLKEKIKSFFVKNA